MSQTRTRTVDCSASCPWVERARKPGTFECTAHGGLFPCPPRDCCGHGDCADTRGHAICVGCGNKVKTFRRTNVRGATKALCSACDARQNP